MAEALIIKTSLQGFKPVTWRRLAVPINITYEQLHAVLQIAYGWQDLQPWAFVPEIASDYSYVHMDYEDADPDADDHDDAALYYLRDDLADGAVDYAYGQWQVRISQVATADQVVLPACLAGAGPSFGDADQIGAHRYSRQAINDVLTIWAADQVFSETAADEGLDQMTDNLVADLTPAQQAIITDFLQSRERKVVADLSDTVIKLELTGLLLDLPGLIGHWPLSQWQAAVAEQAATPEGNDPTTLMIYAQFVQMLSRTNRLVAPLTDVLKLLADVMADDPAALETQPGFFEGFAVSSQRAALTGVVADITVQDVLWALFQTMLDMDPDQEQADEQMIGKAVGQLDLAKYNFSEADLAQVMLAFAAYLRTTRLPGPAGAALFESVQDGLAARRKPAPLAHVAAIDGRKWSKQTAAKVHEQAWRDVDRVWAAAGFAGSRQVVGQAAVGIIDEIYATHLQTPLHWTDEAVTAALVKQLADQPIAAQKAVEGLLSVYLSDRAKHTSLTLARTRALQALIHAQVGKLGHFASHKAVDQDE